MNCSMESTGSRRRNLKLFQMVGPLYAKARWPVIVFIDRLNTFSSAANCRCAWPGIDDHGTQSLAKYSGAKPWTHLYISKATLYMIHWCDASQWRALNSDKSSHGILHPLELIQQALSDANLPAVTGVEATADKCRDQGLCGLLGQRITNSSQLTRLEKAWVLCRHMVCLAELIVCENAEVRHCCWEQILAVTRWCQL